MTVVNNCKKICTGLRRRGFMDDPTRKPYVIPNEVVIQEVHLQKWAPITQLRYLGATGYLVGFGYLNVTEDGDYTLTGEDLNE